MKRLIGLVLVALLLAGCGDDGASGDRNSSDGDSAAGQVTHTFAFEVTATGASTVESVKAGMDITDEGLREEQNAALPWRHEVTVTGFAETMIPQVIVQNLGPAKITVRIEMDGTEICRRSEAGYVDCRVTDLPA